MEIFAKFSEHYNNRKVAGIYCLEYDDGIKIGKSTDLIYRFTAYSSPWCKEPKDLKAFTFEVSHPGYSKKVVDTFEKFVLEAVPMECKESIRHEYVRNISMEQLVELCNYTITEIKKGNTRCSSCGIWGGSSQFGTKDQKYSCRGCLKIKKQKSRKQLKNK